MLVPYVSTLGFSLIRTLLDQGFSNQDLFWSELFLITVDGATAVDTVGRGRRVSAMFLRNSSSVWTILLDLFEQMLINGRFSTSFPSRGGSISTTLSGFFEQMLINGRFWTTKTASGGRESTTFSGSKRILGPFWGSGGRFSTTFLENVAVFRPLFQKMWASFDHQTVICKIMGGVVVDILPP